MTADAKIGLLLGLVFIVIIAFLINGLPNFFKPDDNKEVIVYDVAVPERTPNVRIPIQLNQSTLASRDVPLRVSEPPMREESTPVPDVAADIPEKTPTEPPVKKAESRVYVVKSDDTLGGIAKKVYGAELGNKNATIEAIAKANKLDSKNMIYVGDELVMPSLSPETATVAKAPATGAKKIFKNIADGIGKMMKGEQTVEYVVKDGDCLSKISSEHLGTCKRVNEIVKLNKDQIEDADDIFKGMVIKLPQS